MNDLKRLIKEIIETAVLNGEHSTNLYDEVHYILHNMLGGVRMNDLKRLMKEIIETAVLNGEHSTNLYDEVHYILHNMLGEEE